MRASSECKGDVQQLLLLLLLLLLVNIVFFDSLTALVRTNVEDLDKAREANRICPSKEKLARKKNFSGFSRQNFTKFKMNLII